MDLLIEYLLIPIVFVIAVFLLLLLVTPVLWFLSYLLGVLPIRVNLAFRYTWIPPLARIGRYVLMIALLGYVARQAWKQYNLDLKKLYFVTAVIVGALIWTWRKCDPRSLFSQRYLKPIWDLLEFKARSPYAMLRIPILGPILGRIVGPIVNELEELAGEIKNRHWQIYLRYLFSLAIIFTIPVEVVVPWLTHLLNDRGTTLASYVDMVEKSEKSLHVPLPQWLFGYQAIIDRDAKTLGHYCVLGVDWTLTILILYAGVLFLSNFEPRDLFSSVDKAVRFFVERESLFSAFGRWFVKVKSPLFSFAGYFWRWEADSYGPGAVYTSSEESDGAVTRMQWIGFAKGLHEITESLDDALGQTWQGVNSRVALVLEDIADAGGAAKNGVCIHYRRFGRSGFVVAVDRDLRRFDGKSRESQSNFQRLTASIGRLVNIRESLK